MTSPSPDTVKASPKIIKPTPTIISLNLNPKHKPRSRGGRYRLDTPPKLRAVAKGVFSGGCFGYRAQADKDEGENGGQVGEQAKEQVSTSQETKEQREKRLAKEDRKHWVPQLQERLANGPGRDRPVLVWVPDGPDTETEMERQSILMREDFERFGCGDKGPMVIWLPNGVRGGWRGFRDAFERQMSVEEKMKVEKANEQWKMMRDAQKGCACRNADCTRRMETPKFPPGLGFCHGESSTASSTRHTLLPGFGGRSRGSSMTNNASTRTSEDIDPSTAATSVDVTRNPSSAEGDGLDEHLMSGAVAASEDGMEFNEDERRVLHYYNNEDEDDDSSSYRSPSQDLCQDEIEARKLFGGRFYDEKRNVWHDWKKRTGERNVDMGDTIGFLVRTRSRAKCGLQRGMSVMSRLSGRSSKSRSSGKMKDSKDFELSETMTSTLESHSAGPSASKQHLLSSEPTQDANSDHSDNSGSHRPSVEEASNVSQAESSTPGPDVVTELSEPRTRFAEFKQVLAHTGLHWSGFDSLSMPFKRRKVRQPGSETIRDRSPTL
ncbi:MAG: hypothetical protein M1812_001582 [Candelaria pacifica]|nr:MAG: hypothetical protein M1812_001582 [Candelaria pacifica]